MRWTACMWNVTTTQWDAEYLFFHASPLLIESLEKWLEELTDAA
jgi:hypothetical protein